MYFVNLRTQPYFDSYLTKPTKPTCVFEFIKHGYNYTLGTWYP